MFLFINRKEELAFLEERYSSNSFEFIVVYGRRRIGKTELIKEFVKNKPHIYVLCNKAGTNANVLRFRKEVSKFLSEPEIASENIDEIFSHLTSKAKDRIVVVFDEFSYLAEKDDAVTSVFQAVIDEVLKNKNIMLIICGSSISMMERLLGYKNPLYGRKTGHIKVDFLKFGHIGEFYPSNPIGENIATYAILGGVPFYLEKFDRKRSALDNARMEILSRRGRLYEEADFFLKEEFRGPDVYKSILSAIATGSTKVAEIAGKVGIKASDMDRYLKALISLGLVKREIPATERVSKKSVYSVDDNFFGFYSLFFEPYRSDIEIGETRNFEESLMKNFNAFVGSKFEKLVRTEVIRKVLPFTALRAGRWWGFYREGAKRKELEIDIVALNEQTDEILFAECKWKSSVDAQRILSDLQEKAGHVQWKNNERKEYYAVFAKSFSRKTEQIDGRKAYCFDLKDVGKILRSK